MSTKIDLLIVKPRDSSEILDSHTHVPDNSRIEMLKGYNLKKERASSNSGESTSAIFASGVETMSDTSIIKLPKTESIKRMIRVHNTHSRKISCNSKG